MMSRAGLSPQRWRTIGHLEVLKRSDSIVEGTCMQNVAFCRPRACLMTNLTHLHLSLMIVIVSLDDAFTCDDLIGNANSARAGVCLPQEPLLQCPTTACPVLFLGLLLSGKRGCAECCALRYASLTTMTGCSVWMGCSA
jgi:hypothetical protein